MKDDDGAIFAALHVKLDAVYFQVYRDLERFERVFRGGPGRQRLCPTVIGLRVGQREAGMGRIVSQAGRWSGGKIGEVRTRDIVYCTILRSNSHTMHRTCPADVPKYAGDSVHRPGDLW